MVPDCQVLEVTMIVLLLAVANKDDVGTAAEVLYCQIQAVVDGEGTGLVDGCGCTVCADV